MSIIIRRSEIARSVVIAGMILFWGPRIRLLSLSVHKSRSTHAAPPRLPILSCPLCLG